MIRGWLLSLFLLCGIALYSESVALRKFAMTVDAGSGVCQEFNPAAWSGRTRLVCSQSNCPWSLSLATASEDTLRMALTWRETVEKSFEPTVVLDFTATYGGDAVIRNSVMEKRGVNLSNNDYMVTVAWDMTQGIAVSVAGQQVFSEIPLKAPVTGAYVEAAERRMSFTEWSTEAQTMTMLMEPFQEKYIREYSGNPNDSIAGIYRYFDRDTDPSAAQIGGDYTLAIIPVEGTDSYAVCYLDGATVNRGLWRPGMVKGILTPTEFVGHYNLRWLDADFRIMEAEQYAFFPGNNLLQLVFPLYKSKFRLVRDIEK